MIAALIILLIDSFIKIKLAFLIRLVQSVKAHKTKIKTTGSISSVRIRGLSRFFGRKFSTVAFIKKPVRRGQAFLNGYLGSEVTEADTYVVRRLIQSFFPHVAGGQRAVKTHRA